MGRYPQFTRKLAAALHKEGVLAGTDVYGVPWLIRGRSLQQEVRYLERCGLSRYQALRTATVEPARFLGREKEFGAVAPGLRADLLLLGGNPLEDLARIEQPEGVMVRGVWLPKDKLQALLDSLKG